MAPCPAPPVQKLGPSPLLSNPGGTLLSTLYFLEDGTTKTKHVPLAKGTATGLVANVIAYGFVVASLECKQAFLVDQTISLNCDNAVLGDEVSVNPNCKRCKDVVAQIQNDRKKLERDARTLNASCKNCSSKVEQRVLDVVNGELKNHNDGLCQYVCMQCVARNITQNVEIKLTQDCAVDDKNFIKSFTSGMSHQAAQEIEKHQKTLNGAGYKINTTQDIKTLAVQLTDSIVDISTTCHLTSLRSQALVVQSFTIRSGSTSVVAQNVSQSISLAMFSSVVSDVFTEDYVKTNIQYENLKTQIEQQTSFKNLLIEAEATVKTIGNLLESTAGKVLITIIAMLLTGVVLFAAVFYFRPEIIFGSVDDDDFDIPM